MMNAQRYDHPHLGVRPRSTAMEAGGMVQPITVAPSIAERWKTTHVV